MSLRRRVAWSVPLVTAGAVVAAGVLPQTASSGPPALPARSAAELLVAVQRSSTTALSGTVVQTSRLGLPTLPGSDQGAALTVSNLAAGSHSARIWVDGPERQRVALLGQLAESDLVHNGRDVWTYTSATRTATHDVLPAHSAANRGPSRDARGPASSGDARELTPSGDARDLTPQAAADRALAAVEPTTVVTVDNTAYVAGRPVYTLRLAPRDTRSTVRAVLVAVDSQTSVPPRVQVFGAAAEPAFETGFTDVSFTRPPASVFAFSPPRGATVKTRQHALPAEAAAQPTPRTAPAPGVTPTVLGKGWTSVLVVPQVPTMAPARGQDSAAALLDRLAVRQPDGSRLLRTTLVNALLTADGRLLAGAVTPEELQRAAEQTR